jgi:hypothetical protein
VEARSRHSGQKREDGSSDLHCDGFELILDRNMFRLRRKQHSRGSRQYLCPPRLAICK